MTISVYVNDTDYHSHKINQHLNNVQEHLTGKNVPDNSVVEMIDTSARVHAPIAIKSAMTS